MRQSTQWSIELPPPARRRYACLLGLALVQSCVFGWSGSASAQSAASASTQPVKPPDCRVKPWRRSAAVAAALLPGAIVHGAGHWVACESESARKLAALELAGVTTTLGSGAGLALTGASRYVVAPLALGALAGLGLFSVTLFADLYGVLAPVVGRGEPQGRRPAITLQSGVSTIYDPQFEYRWLGSHGFKLQSGKLWLAPRLDVALDSQNRRYALQAGRRLLGPSQRASGSALAVEGAISDHSYDAEGFATTTAELRLAGRLDLESVASTLRGSFAEVSAGYARQWTRFDASPGDAVDELLARIAFGVYLGREGSVQGESWIAYDHRRDTFAGGLQLPGIPAGYAGYVEQRTELYFSRAVGAAVELQYGSAALAGAYLLLRWGETP